MVKGIEEWSKKVVEVMDNDVVSRKDRETLNELLKYGRPYSKEHLFGIKDMILDKIDFLYSEKVIDTSSIDVLYDCLKDVEEKISKESEIEFMELCCILDPDYDSDSEDYTGEEYIGEQIIGIIRSKSDLWTDSDIDILKDFVSLNTFVTRELLFSLKDVILDRMNIWRSSVRMTTSDQDIVKENALLNKLVSKLETMTNIVNAAIFDKSKEKFLDLCKEIGEEE